MRKLALSLLLIMLGFASLDAVLDHPDPIETSVQNEVQAKHDGTSFPP